MSQTLKEEIIAYSKTIGIDAIGFTTAEPFEELRPKLEAYYAKGYASCFEESDIELRIDPRKSMASAESIIAIAVGYPNKLPGAPKSIRGERRGMFARSSWGMDYHSLLQETAAATGSIHQVASTRGGVSVNGRHRCIK